MIWLLRKQYWFAILLIVVFEYSIWGILKNGNDKIQTFPKELWWRHTVRMPTPCWMVSGCCMKSATLVMMAVQSSQVQSPRKLFTCWRYFWFQIYNARDWTAMIIHLAKAKALTGVASSDESRIEAVGHVSPPLNEGLGIMLRWEMNMKKLRESTQSIEHEEI